MAKNLFVGSLPWSVNDEQLAQIFGEAGTVESARVITERDTGRSKGFGFVEMPNDDEARAAISQLHETEQSGRNIVVNESTPRPEGERPAFKKRPSYGGGGNRGGGGYNRGGRDGGEY